LLVPAPCEEKVVLLVDETVAAWVCKLEDPHAFIFLHVPLAHRAVLRRTKKPIDLKCQMVDLVGMAEKGFQIFFARDSLLVRLIVPITNETVPITCEDPDVLSASERISSYILVSFDVS